MHLVRAAAGLAFALAGATLAAPAQAAPAAAIYASDADAAHRRLRELDQRLYAVGWRLVTGNAAFCRDTVPALGVLWQDLATYPDPALAGAALGAEGPVFVQAVAPGSPGAEARLQVGDTLAAVGVVVEGDGPAHYQMTAMSEAFPPTQPSWQRLVTLQDTIDRILRREGEVVLMWRDARSGVFIRTTLDPVPACMSRFEVSGIGQRAVADGDRVVFGEAFPGFAWAEDEFASAVAHELAHNLLAHRAWLDRAERSRARIRQTEDEADRLVPWLLANAGYDPAAAPRFMRRWGPVHDGGIFRRRTHSGWDERAEMIAAQLPLIAAARSADGKADWSRWFARTTEG